MSGTPKKPVTITASATLNDENHQGTVVNLSAATGLTVTLPPATGSGHKYTLFVKTTVTSNSYIVKVTGNDIIQGSVAISTDIAGVTCPTASDSDTITMNGSTTGGVKGTCIELQDVDADLWSISGVLVSTGAEATPFSATVT
jgi:hypothetical protein